MNPSYRYGESSPLIDSGEKNNGIQKKNNNDDKQQITSDSSSGATTSSYRYLCGGMLFRGNREALGYALDSMARATVFACWGASYLPTLQKLATSSAGCHVEWETGTTADITPEQCTAKIFGIKPSSLLTSLLTIVGLGSACLAPAVGAWVDTTHYRRTLGRSISIAISILMIPTVFLQQSNWPFNAVVFMILSFGFWMHTLVSYSYLPELADDPDILNEFTQGISLFTFTGMVFFLVLVVGTSALLEFDDVAMAHLSQAVMFFLFAGSTFVSWGFCFQERPPAHPPLEGHRNVWTAGVAQLSFTMRNLHRHYTALKWYYLAVCVAHPAIGAMLVINMTYLEHMLNFSSQEVGLCVTTMLLCCIPGAILSTLSIKYCLNPLHTVIASLLLMSIVVAATALLLSGPAAGGYAYFLAGLWGIGMGCNFTSDRVVVASLLPEGQDSELMGLYLFASQALNWLPVLIYTTMNEAGFSPRSGVATLDIFFFLGILCFFRVGDFHDAVKTAERQPRTTR